MQLGGQNQLYASIIRGVTPRKHLIKRNTKDISFNSKKELTLRNIFEKTTTTNLLEIIRGAITGGDTFIDL